LDSLGMAHDCSGWANDPGDDRNELDLIPKIFCNQ
jgi:hypothetical protein